MKRRRALELEVKRNEKIQSEHTTTSGPSAMENVSTRACHKVLDGQYFSLNLSWVLVDL